MSLLMHELLTYKIEYTCVHHVKYNQLAKLSCLHGGGTTFQEDLFFLAIKHGVICKQN